MSVEHLNHWHCWKLIFCNYSLKFNPFLIFHKNMSQGSIRNKQTRFKVNNKSTTKSEKVCPKLTKTSKHHDRHCCGISVVKLTFVCRVVVPLIFKIVRKRKKVCNKCKSEKIPKADTAPRNRS